MWFILVNSHQVFPAHRKSDWNKVRQRSVKVLVCLAATRNRKGTHKHSVWGLHRLPTPAPPSFEMPQESLSCQIRCSADGSYSCTFANVCPVCFPALNWLLPKLTRWATARPTDLNSKSTGCTSCNLHLTYGSGFQNATALRHGLKTEEAIAEYPLQLIWHA